MRRLRRQLLWVAAVAVLAFQLGFRPIGLSKVQTLQQLTEAKYEFAESLVGIPKEKQATTESALAESSPAESAPAESAPAESATADQAQAESATDAESASLSESEPDGSEGMTEEDLKRAIWDLLEQRNVAVLKEGIKVVGSTVTVQFALTRDDPESVAVGYRRTTLEALNSEFSDRAGPARLVMSEKDQEAQELVLYQLGRLQLRRPAAQVKLGLDLRGGTRLVMEAVPVTRYTFEEPAAEQDESALASGESAEVTESERPAEAPATESGSEVAEETSPESAPEASDEDAAAVAASRKEWQAAADDLSAHLAALGLQVRSVTPTTRGLVAEVVTATREESERVREEIRAFLRQSKPNVVSTETQSSFIAGDTMDRVREIMQRRVDGFGLTEPVIQVQGDRRIIVEIAGTTPEEIEEVLDEPAQLKFVYINPNRFRLDLETIPAAERDPKRPEKKDRIVVRDAVTGETVEHVTAVNDPSTEVVITGADLEDNSSAQPGNEGAWEVNFQVKPGAADRLRDFTSRHMKEMMPIVLNNVIESAPVIQSTIGSRGRITGGFTLQEANNLKTLLNAGALPVALDIVENREVSATLGAQNVKQSLYAGVLGLILVFILMAAYYRLPGLVADVALFLYCGIVLAVLVMFDATLTLTGIAGLILGVGMAVDANILIFERMKEELRTKSLSMALRVGFERAWTAILDSNVTTLLTAVVLWMFGSGGVRGFATTLIVSVLASMFSAIYVSRVLLEAVVSSRLGNYAVLYLGARPESVRKEEPRRGRRPLE